MKSKEWLYNFVCYVCSLAENHTSDNCCVPLLVVQAMQGQTFEWLMLHLGGYGWSLITAHCP